VLSLLLATTRFHARGSGQLVSDRFIGWPIERISVRVSGNAGSDLPVTATTSRPANQEEREKAAQAARPVWAGEAWCGMVWHGVAWCGMEQSGSQR